MGDLPFLSWQPSIVAAKFSQHGLPPSVTNLLEENAIAGDVLRDLNGEVLLEIGISSEYIDSVLRVVTLLTSEAPSQPAPAAPTVPSAVAITPKERAKAPDHEAPTPPSFVIPAFVAPVPEKLAPVTPVAHVPVPDTVLDAARDVPAAPVSPAASVSPYQEILTVGEMDDADNETGTNKKDQQKPEVIPNATEARDATPSANEALDSEERDHVSRESKGTSHKQDKKRSKKSSSRSKESTSSASEATTGNEDTVAGVPKDQKKSKKSSRRRPKLDGGSANGEVPEGKKSKKSSSRKSRSKPGEEPASSDASRNVSGDLTSSLSGAAPVQKALETAAAASSKTTTVDAGYVVFGSGVKISVTKTLPAETQFKREWIAELQPFTCFVGELGADDAEKILRDESSGKFFARLGSTGHVVLSFITKRGDIRHTRVLKDDLGRPALERTPGQRETFPNMTELIEACQSLEIFGRPCQSVIEFCQVKKDW